VVVYILGPFALVKTHDTMTDDTKSDLGKVISTYICIV
jgi:hypothetical protein